MTNQIKSSLKLVLFATVFVLIVILLVPAVAFAESEAEQDAGSVDSTTQSSLETSLSDSFGDTPTQEPSSDSPDNLSFEPSPESAPLESDPVEENSADSELNSPGVINESTSQTYSEEPVDPLPAEGDCYVATITPDAVVFGSGSYTDGAGNPVPNSGSSGTFTVTFAEIGNESIGSARVEIPAGFTSIVYDTDWTTSGISTNDGQEWEGKLDGMFIYLRAFDAAQLLYKDDYVSVTFQAVTPGTTGVYEFETRAWTGITADFDAAGTNDMAVGYIDPVVIVGMPVANDNDLSNIPHVINGHYVQVADIDLSGLGSGDGWDPIGSGSTPFSGSYNGNGYTITNLTINRSTLNGVGLFGHTGSDSFILNVDLTGVEIRGKDSTGGLIGKNIGGTIIDCSVSGDVEGDYFVGGLVGWNSGFVIDSYATGDVSGNNHIGGLAGTNGGSIIDSCAKGDVSGYNFTGGLIGTNFAPITDCHATGDVSGNDHVGGLVGYNAAGSSTEGTITDSSATGAVSGNNKVGGLVGQNVTGGIITSSYATGSVTSSGNSTGGLVGFNYSAINESFSAGAVNGSSSVGGLVGDNYDGTITNSYAAGNVSGINLVGGLIGNDWSGTFTNCYAVGVVTGASHVGGLIGATHGTITKCYYDRETTGRSDNDGRGVPKSTTEMRNIATFSGWDVVTLNNFNPDALPGDSDFHVWYIDQGKDYPRLWWQYEAPGGGGSGSFNGDGYNLDMSWFTMQMLGLPKPEGLVFGSSPYITLQFVERGSRDQLAEVREAYGQFLQAFELKKDRLSAGEHARQSIELAIAWAAILAREAALAANAGQAFDLGAVISAYQNALNLLAVYGHLLTGYQQAYAHEVLNGIAAIITGLGG